MEKFLNVPVYSLIMNGTSVTPVGDADLTDTGNVFANVSVGDIVHESTGNKYFVVTSKIDSNNLTLTALDGGTLPIVSGKSFFIHSGSSYNNQLVSIGDVGLIEQLSTSTTTIAYDSPAAVDLITLVHTPVTAGSESMRDQVQEQMEEALITSWTDVAPEPVLLDYKVIGISIG